MNKWVIFDGGSRHKDKYNKKRINQFLINRFMNCVVFLVKKSGKNSFFEIGCGEGQILGVLFNEGKGVSVSGIDVELEAVEITKSNFKKYYNYDIKCEVGTVYDENDYNEGMIICCEVLEHLDNPQLAIQKIVENTDEYFIVSVPREPLWCMLNIARGKYIKRLGNTPGHINHWSKRSFVKFVNEYADVIEVKNPIPWTMILAKVRKEEV